VNLFQKIWHTARLLGPLRTAKFAFARLRRRNPIPLWEDDTDFRALYDEIQSHTLIDIRRAHMLYQFASHAAHLPGAAAEVGVYRGGSAKLLARVLSGANKTVHLFDTFAGMPTTDEKLDFHRTGDFADTSLAAVQKYLAACQNVAFHAGLFPDTAAPLENEQFCFAYIDVDIHASVRAACEFFHHRLVSGGILLFDDYGQLTCPGARRAVDDFFAATPESPCYLPTGQCFILKL